MSIANNAIFRAVRQHLDCMLEFGRDASPDDPSPLFSAIVEPRRQRTITHRIIPVPGMRLGDLSWAGSNMILDLPMLESLNVVSQVTGDPRYRQAADDALAFFAKHCPHPDTGLFPWGEHAQWSFYGRRTIPNCSYEDPQKFLETNAIIHDHLCFAPAWFWEGIWQANPAAVTGFATGLHGHIMNDETFEHNRHAPLTSYSWNEKPYKGAGKDFARHAGFFIFDALYAYHRSGDDDHLHWACQKLNNQLGRRHPNGILRGPIRTPNADREGQHDSFALSLYDGAAVLGRETAAGREFGDAADELFAARAKSPHAPDDTAIDAAWNWGYGVPSGPGPRCAITAQVYERTGAEWAAAQILEAAAWQAAAPAPPKDQVIVAGAFWRNLVPPLAAYAVTEDDSHLERAKEVADWAITQLTEDGMLVAVCNMNWYFNMNMYFSIGDCAQREDKYSTRYYINAAGVNDLLRDLLHVALLEEGMTLMKAADYRR